MNYYLLILSIVVSGIVLQLNYCYFLKRSFIKFAVIFSTIIPFWSLGYADNYKSISIMSLFYILLAILEEERLITSRVFFILLTLLTFSTVLIGLNEIIFDKNRIMTMKVDIFKTVLTTMWIMLSIFLFRMVNFYNGLIPVICFIVSVFSFSIYIQTGFLSKSILVLMNLFIGSLFSVIYFNFPPAKISLSKSDATFLGYIFGIFLCYSVNYSIIYTGLIIPILMLILPVLFIIFLIVFSCNKKFYNSELALKNPYRWNITEKSFVIYITITTLYLNLMVYFVYKEESFFLLTIFFLTAIITLFSTGKAIFLKKEKAVFCDSIQILGVRIDNVKMDMAVSSVCKGIENDEKFYITTPNSIIVYECRNDPDLMRIINGSKLNVPDGIGLIWAADFSHTPLNERVPGIDFMLSLCKKAEEKGNGIYLLGSTQEVLEKTCSKLVKTYPELNISGFHNGYFSDSDSSAIIDDINNSGARILFVALGVPRQEKWLDDNFDKLKINCAMGVGGSYDVISGTLNRAPEFMQNLGFEWLYRLWQEPNRIGRILNLPKFVREVLRDYLEKQKERSD